MNPYEYMRASRDKVCKQTYPIIDNRLSMIGLGDAGSKAAQASLPVANSLTSAPWLCLMHLSVCWSPSGVPHSCTSQLPVTCCEGSLEVITPTVACGHVWVTEHTKHTVGITHHNLMTHKVKTCCQLSDVFVEERVFSNSGRVQWTAHNELATHGSAVDHLHHVNEVLGLLECANKLGVIW